MSVEARDIIFLGSATMPENDTTTTTFYKLEVAGQST